MWGSVKERGGEGLRAGVGTGVVDAADTGWDGRLGRGSAGGREKGTAAPSHLPPGPSVQLGRKLFSSLSFEVVKHQGVFPMGTEVTFILSQPFPTSASHTTPAGPF